MIDYLEKFKKMRIAGNLAARTLDMLTEKIKPGVTTEFIDKLGYEGWIGAEYIPVNGTEQGLGWLKQYA